MGRCELIRFERVRWGGSRLPIPMRTPFFHFNTVESVWSVTDLCCRRPPWPGRESAVHEHRRRLNLPVGFARAMRFSGDLCPKVHSESVPAWAPERRDLGERFSSYPSFLDSRVKWSGFDFKRICGEIFIVKILNSGTGAFGFPIPDCEDNRPHVSGTRT